MSFNGHFGPGDSQQQLGQGCLPSLRQSVPVPAPYFNPPPVARDLTDMGLSLAYRHCICFVCSEKFAYLHTGSGYMVCSKDCVEMAQEEDLFTSESVRCNPSQYADSGSRTPYHANNIVVTTSNVLGREDYTMGEPTAFGYNSDAVDAQHQPNEPVKIKIEKFTEEFQTKVSLEPQFTAAAAVAITEKREPQQETSESNVKCLKLDVKTGSDVVGVKKEKVPLKEQLNKMLAKADSSSPQSDDAEKNRRDESPVKKCSSAGSPLGKGIDVSQIKTKPMLSENGQVDNTNTVKEMNQKTNMEAAVPKPIKEVSPQQMNDNVAEGVGESTKLEAGKLKCYDILPLNHGRSVGYSPRLVDGATVKMLFYWSPKKIMVTEVEDENTIFNSLQPDIEEMLNKYDLTLNHTPIVYDFYLGRYNNGDYYRGCVTKCDADKQRVHFEFVDLGDHCKLEFSDLRMMTKELMDKHPIYSKSFLLNNVPSPSPTDPKGFHSYFEQKVDEVFMAKKLKIQILDKRKMILTDVETGKTLADYYYEQLAVYIKKNGMDNEKA